MNPGPRGRVGLAAPTVLLSLLLGPPADAGEGSRSLTWERAFPVSGRAVDVHLRASFTGRDGQPHQLELWRQGETFLHRRTDDALDLFVVAHERGRYD